MLTTFTIFSSNLFPVIIVQEAKKTYICRDIYNLITIKSIANEKIHDKIHYCTVSRYGDSEFMYRFFRIDQQGVRLEQEP